MRIMGLDYGSVTVGVAISDELHLTAQGIEVIRRKQENKLRQTLARIEQLAEEYEVGKIVLGYPKNMNNTLGTRAMITLEFKEKLERAFGIEVIMEDERLTSVISNNVLISADISRKKRKKKVDGIAAVLILQSYLDRINN